MISFFFFFVQAGGFNKLLLDSLYEDETARRQIQLQNAGYGQGGMSIPNPFDRQQDPFMMSNNIAPPPNVQMAKMAQQQQQQQQPYQHNMIMVPHQYSPQYPQQCQYPQQHLQQMGSSNPFGDPLSFPPPSTTPQQGNHGLI